jgi:hypothetical protein
MIWFRTAARLLKLMEIKYKNEVCVCVCVIHPSCYPTSMFKEFGLYNKLRAIKMVLQNFLGNPNNSRQSVIEIGPLQVGLS